jgi:transposase
MDSILSAFRDWKEWRRRRALALKEQGWTQRAIAQALGVSEAAVSQWLAAARQAGPGALRSHPPPGVAPKLTAAQKRLTPEFLWHGPEAYGFRGQVWACARIAKVIEEEFGVSYHKGHVGRLLAELRWTPQVPIRRSCVKSSTSPSAAFDRSPGWCNPSLRRPDCRLRKLKRSAQRSVTGCCW